jgi:nucleoside-diphosphate-sugar epimerase
VTKTALVTGSAGFAGRHYVKALKKRGYAVLGLDPRNPGALSHDDALYFFEHDWTRFDLVVHCAAVVGGRANIDGAPLALAVNLQLDAAMFRWALSTKPGRVVYVSSSAAYPVPFQSLKTRTALTEGMIDPTLGQGFLCAPDQLYGWAKLTGENLAYRARQEGLAVTVIRPFSGYGADQDVSYPFRAFIERARGREDPFLVWGNPRQCRDFIHIDDIVEATMIMCEEGLDGPVNIGTGNATALGDLALLVAQIAGYTPELRVNPDAPMGVEYRVADATLMRQFYTPKVSLEEGIARALS